MSGHDEQLMAEVRALRGQLGLWENSEHVCDQGWVCEQHPNREWPHNACAGPGMPCRYRLRKKVSWTFCSPLLRV